ncbi:tetratricopeptide repeat protein [Shewanella surugensis]|uniref:Tetratricopeptide repeat protein n=1 Tax=Shewanella surugensis TaxID=212020 RepID=A0ABT0LF99_9GAMM|nr:tetratricopeptide repeat protein [Shewanella surugensis]MCL1126379.1 tetratricopeptide repeat protein [Shewanella surugensis]
MRFTLSLFFLFHSLIPYSSSFAGTHNSQSPQQIQVGDILINNSHLQWYTVHIVALDNNDVLGMTAHAILYKASTNKPSLSLLTPNNIASQHSQMDIDSFQDWHKLTHKKPTPQDLEGYIHYLKHANFEHYVHYTGQNSAQIIAKSNALDKKAHREKRQGHHDKAIHLYQKAIELYPTNVQAMEHLASLYMDSDLFDEALALFESSLHLHPDNSTGQLLLGQCLLHMGRFYQAKRVFQDGIKQYPEQKALFTHYHQCALEEQNNRNNIKMISL